MLPPDCCSTHYNPRSPYIPTSPPSIIVVLPPKVSLELGGKSPMIICDDADLEQALDVAHVGLFLNQGQACCASSRIFVQEGIYDEFVKGAVERAEAVKVGPFTEEGVEQGPQVDDIQFKKVLGYIGTGKEEGATVMTGGGRYGDKGYFVQPTVFTGKCFV